ncbi:MAG: aminoglycoside phosphotransferase family protein [Xanthobacteraceae bacterium]
MFEEYIARWQLVPDGAPIVTHSSRLLPVIYGREKAMLKIAIEAEEQFGGVLMEWWNGDGAARLLAYEKPALLLERAQGERSLHTMAKTGSDDESTRILCETAARLHAKRDKPLLELIPLRQWFLELEESAEKYGGVILKASAVAERLLSDPRDVTTLHGDLHHDNVLDFGARGWLAIDPKRLVGERGFDFANIFCNPDFEVAAAPGRLARQAKIVAETAKLEHRRLLQWILAYAGLSAVWIMNSGETDRLDIDLAVAELAAQALE